MLCSVIKKEGGEDIPPPYGGQGEGYASLREKELFGWDVERSRNHTKGIRRGNCILTCCVLMTWEIMAYRTNSPRYALLAFAGICHKLPLSLYNIGSVDDFTNIKVW